MRLIHLISTLLSGGAQQQLAYLAGEQAKAGHDVHVGYLRRGPKLGELEKTAAVLHPLSVRSNHEPRLFIEMYRLIRRVAPDIVQTWLLQMDIVGGLASRISGRPWIVTERSTEAAYSTGLKPIARAVLARQADAIVSNSSLGDAYWAARVRPTVLRRVIPNAVPAKEIFETAPRSQLSMGLPAAHGMVLYAGRLSPEKNLETLIPALGEISRRLPVTSFLCGDGTHEREAESLIGELGLGSAVRLVGYVDDVWGWMKRADVFVSVGHFEGNPNTVLEAAASGCPLVLSDIPSHRQMLKETEAVFVDRTSPVAIADAIERVLRESAEARRRAEAARTAVAALSVKAMARSYDEVYRAVLERRSKKNPP